MKKENLSCPYCSGRLEITEVHCPKCKKTIRGAFQSGPFAALSEEELEFTYQFIIHEGRIKKLEKVYNISYPSVRKKLDALIEHLREIGQAE